ncbi:isochorismatase family cysteine hydrolase [Streptomyces sp. NPDC005805]|uniref:cysteine hydrolase family protein n=1 Tax=Streptomyces sp. NPDC005805 TaxID=3157068 RepID=UPI0033E672F4
MTGGGRGAGAPSAGGRDVGAHGTVLVVVDLQNDFVTGPVAGARYRGDPARPAAVAAATARAVAEARARGVEVVFVRFTGDATDQGPSWRLRDAELGKRPKCLEGSWGAEFHSVAPEPGEAVFTKRACFDAFLAEGFGGHLAERGTTHLVLAGLFADVCVDSTARTAFQKGLHITVLADCTTAVHLADEDVLRFMRLVYGARVTTHDQAEVWSRSPGEEVPCPSRQAPPPSPSDRSDRTAARNDRTPASREA